MGEKDETVLSPQELRESIERERKWLEENNGVSAVTDGPVEDLEGVPLPADFFQGTPPAHTDESPPKKAA